MIIDAGPLIADSERPNSRLWALVKRAAERGEPLHTTHPVLAQVWRDPARQANLSRALRHFDVHAPDESVAVGRRLAATGISDVVDAHLAVVAETLGTFIVTTDYDDMDPPGRPLRVPFRRVSAHAGAGVMDHSRALCLHSGYQGRSPESCDCQRCLPLCVHPTEERPRRQHLPSGPSMPVFARFSRSQSGRSPLSVVSQLPPASSRPSLRRRLMTHMP